MNTAPTPRPMTVSLELQRAEQSRLHGRWLILARVVCFTLIVLALLFFFATLPVDSTQLQTICQTATCATGQLTPQMVGILQNHGLSVTGYVILNAVLTIAFAFVWFAVAGVLLWRKSDDAMALLVTSLWQEVTRFGNFRLCS
jgi:hypothetical protein